MNTIYRRGMSLILSAAFISSLTLELSAEEKVKPLKDKPLKKLNIPKAGLPRDLVYLKAIAPTIREDIRYATANNFTGAPLPGYYRGACILRRGAALALKQVQAELMSRSPQLSLKVYHCYRPVRAVKAMLRWSKRAPNPELKRIYFPQIAKRNLFSSGYISARSTHSTGSTVDLSIVNVSRVANSASSQLSGARDSCTTSGQDANDPSVLDMGTAYDCFDTKSHTWNKRVSAAQIRNRKLLVRVMQRHGFINYRREWWHFTHGPSRSRRSFNVPVR